MEPEISSGASPSKLSYIFYNDHGLRAGWRLLIYIGMIFILVWGVGLIAKRVTSGHAMAAPSSDFVRAIVQGISELILFGVLLFLAWIMSRIQHRSVGLYGLPLQRSAISRFIRGYFFWGFLPLAILLSILRVLHVFYFGNLSPLNWQIISWGALWFIFFLLVGLTEEYSLRGYFLYTLADGIGFWPAAIIQAVYLPARIWATAVKQELESSQRQSSPYSQPLLFGAPGISGSLWALTPDGTGGSHFSLA